MPQRIYNGALNCCGDKLQSANVVQRSTHARSPDKIRAPIKHKIKYVNEARPGGGGVTENTLARETHLSAPYEKVESQSAPPLSVLISQALRTLRNPQHAAALRLQHTSIPFSWFLLSPSVANSSPPRCVEQHDADGVVFGPSEERVHLCTTGMRGIQQTTSDLF